MKVRKVDSKDRDEWARMRNLPWDSSLTEHLVEIERYLSNYEKNIVNIFVLEKNHGRLGGFIELNIRNYAEGSELGVIPYIEGWYVDPDIRNNGHGKQLITMAEDWAIDNGFKELASDTELENITSVAIHKASGFQEVERIVCFIKKII